MFTLEQNYCCFFLGGGGLHNQRRAGLSFSKMCRLAKIIEIALKKIISRRDGVVAICTSVSAENGASNKN